MMDSHHHSRYSFRHSHFCKLHSRFRYCFSAYTTLPYPALKVQPKLRFVS